MKKYLPAIIILAIFLIYLLNFFYLTENKPSSLPKQEKQQKQEPNLELSLKEKINQILNQEEFSGAILVAKGNEILASVAKGYANLKEGIQNRENTEFPISSITKLFTAAAILRLQELGKINLKETIEYYLKKDHPVWAGNPPDFIDHISIEELLTHTSGLEDYKKLSAYRKFNLDLHSKDELIQFFSDYPTKFMPGSAYDYSAANYILLGAIIEEVSKQTYGDFLKAEFFDPLNMSSTFVPKADFLSTITADHPLFAFGYDQSGSQIEDLNFSTLFADAGAISTTNDLYTFAKALFRGNILPKEQLTEMETPRLETRNKGLFVGYGLFITENKDKKPIYLSFGQLEGYESALSYDKENEFLVIILSNQVDGKAEILAKKLLESILELSKN